MEDGADDMTGSEGHDKGKYEEDDQGVEDDEDKRGEGKLHESQEDEDWAHAMKGGEHDEDKDEEDDQGFEDRESELGEGESEWHESEEDDDLADEITGSEGHDEDKDEEDDGGFGDHEGKRGKGEQHESEEDDVTYARKKTSIRGWKREVMSSKIAAKVRHFLM